MEIENKWSNLLLNAIFILLCACCIFPVLLTISISFTDQEAIFKEGYKLIPSKVSLDAYRYVFSSNLDVGRSYLVTIATTVVGTIISVMTIALYAYPLSRPDLKFKKFFTFYVFFTMLFNGGLVAWYMVVTRVLNLQNTFWGLVLPNAMSAWYVIIMRTFFQTGVPNSMIEAGKIDGASEYRIFFTMVIPVAIPAFATIALFQTLMYWNEWFNPMLLITDPKLYNLQYMLQVIMKELQMLSEGTMSSDVASKLSKNVPQEAVRMALCVVVMGPILFVYPFFQKYFIQGLTVGSVKG